MGEDIREGLTAIVSVKIGDPQFEGQTKQKLGNSEAEGAVDNIVSTQLQIFLEQNPNVAKMTVEKSVMAQRAREAARKARDFDEKKICIGDNVTSGKTSDCSDKNRQTVKFTSSRVTLPAVRQRRQETERHRQFFRFEEKF